MSDRTSGSDGERLLAVVAHPDDETFGCGSLIAHATAKGVTTVVVCATRGEAGTPRPGSGLDHADMAVVREDELRSAAALLGVAQVELFSWVDSGMDGDASDRHRHDGTPRTAGGGDCTPRIADLAVRSDAGRPAARLPH